MLVYRQEKLLLQGKKWELKVFIGNAKIFKNQARIFRTLTLIQSFSALQK